MQIPVVVDFRKKKQESQTLKSFNYCKLPLCVIQYFHYLFVNPHQIPSGKTKIDVEKPSYVDHVGGETSGFPHVFYVYPILYPVPITSPLLEDYSISQLYHHL